MPLETMNSTFPDAYRQICQQQHKHIDPAQLKLCEALEALDQQLQCSSNTPSSKKQFFKFFKRKKQPPYIQGLYIYGDVGRGKTWIMDLFFQHSHYEKKQRIHFHHFMQDIHQQLQQTQGKDPLEDIAKHIAQHTQLLCLDEFHVVDIASAMILSGLLIAFFKQGITLITTSNTPPDALYKDGLQRERFLPAIELIKAHCQQHYMDSTTDYRFSNPQTQAFPHLWPANDEHSQQVMLSCMGTLCHDQTHLHLNHRKLPILAQSEEAIFLEFSVICQAPRGAADYIWLARHYSLLLIANVPTLTESNDDMAKRFIHLIDSAYDEHCQVGMSYNGELVDIYQGRECKETFERTLSRLHEMLSLPIHR